MARRTVDPVRIALHAPCLPPYESDVVRQFAALAKAAASDAFTIRRTPEGEWELYAAIPLLDGEKYSDRPYKAIPVPAGDDGVALAREPREFTEDPVEGTCVAVAPPPDLAAERERSVEDG